MVKSLPPGKDHSRGGPPDFDTIQRLQRKYSQARLASGDLTPEILAKIGRWQKLKAKLSGPNRIAYEADVKELDRLVQLTGELMPHLHFEVADVDWDAPDVERLLAQGVMPKPDPGKLRSDR